MQPSVLASWLLISVYAAAIVVLVVHGARRNRSIEDYAVGTLAFSPIAVGLALAATTTSAATYIINPGLVAYYGLSAVFGLCVVFPISMAISLVVLTKGFRAYGSSVHALTLPQWIGQRYQSRSFAICFACLSMLLITFIVMILVGLTKVIAASLGLGEIGVLSAVVVFSFGYMMFGGANSMVYTNTIQAVIMIVVALILLGSGLEFFSDGIVGFLARLRAIDPDLVSLYNPHSPLFRDAFEVVFCTFVVGIAIACQPHIITKSLLLKRQQDVNRYLVVGIAVQTLFFLVVFFGIYARLTFPTLEHAGAIIAPDSITSTYLVTRFHWFIGVLVLLGLISAGMSTLEGLIQSLSIILTNDLVKNLHSVLTGKQLTDRFLFVLNRVMIGVLATVAFALSYRQLIAPNLSVIIFAQLGVYGFFAAAFVPIVFGTFLKEMPTAAAFAAATAAVVVHFTLYLTGGNWFPYYEGMTVRNPGISTALGVVAAILVGIIGYAFGRQQRPA